MENMENQEAQNAQNVSITEKLGNKIGSLLERYDEVQGEKTRLEEENHGLREELERVRNELTASKASGEAKDNEIRKLEEDLQLKELEIEEILGKIEQVLG